MPATLTASVRREAAKATLTLPFRIPPNRNSLSIQETATALDMSTRFVEDLFDKADDDGKGDLAGHKHNGSSGARNTKRIPVIFVAAYLIKTATYSDESLLDCLISSIENLPAESLLRLASAARSSAEKKSHGSKLHRAS